MISSSDPEALPKLRREVASAEAEFDAARGPARVRARSKLDRLRRRVEDLEEQARKGPPADVTIGAWRAHWDPELGRVQVTGPKPVDDLDKRRVRAIMSGWNWSPKNRAWQRMTTPASWDSAISALRRLDVKGSDAAIPAGRSDYSDRVEAKQQRRIETAASLRADADAKQRRSSEMLPDWGSPVLVGHHSEKRHRRDLERSDALMRKAVESSARADELERLAVASVSSKAISSDDPEAVPALRSRLVELEREREALKAAGKAAKNDPADLLMQGSRFSPKHERGVRLTNLGANIRRVRERLAELEASATATIPADLVIGPVSAHWDADTNRVQVFSPRPSQSERKSRTAIMRSAGFVWSREAGAWQRKASPSAWSAAVAVAVKVAEALPDRPAALADVAAARAADARISQTYWQGTQSTSPARPPARAHEHKAKADALAKLDDHHPDLARAAGVQRLDKLTPAMTRARDARDARRDAMYETSQTQTPPRELDNFLGELRNLASANAEKAEKRVNLIRRKISRGTASERNLDEAQIEHSRWLRLEQAGKFATVELRGESRANITSAEREAGQIALATVDGFLEDGGKNTETKKALDKIGVALRGFKFGGYFPPPDENGGPIDRDLKRARDNDARSLLIQAAKRPDDEFELWAGALSPPRGAEKNVAYLAVLEPMMRRIRDRAAPLLGKGRGLTAAEVDSISSEALEAVRAWNGAFVFARHDGSLPAIPGDIFLFATDRRDLRLAPAGGGGGGPGGGSKPAKSATLPKPPKRKREAKLSREREREAAKLSREREREAAKLNREREREAAKLEREAAKLSREREREAAKLSREREREAAKLNREREREAAKLGSKRERSAFGRPIMARREYVDDLTGLPEHPGPGSTPSGRMVAILRPKGAGRSVTIEVDPADLSGIRVPVKRTRADHYRELARAEARRALAAAPGKPLRNDSEIRLGQLGVRETFDSPAAALAEFEQLNDDWFEGHLRQLDDADTTDVTRETLGNLSVGRGRKTGRSRKSVGVVKTSTGQRILNTPKGIAQVRAMLLYLFGQAPKRQWSRVPWLEIERYMEQVSAAADVPMSWVLPLGSGELEDAEFRARLATTHGHIAAEKYAQLKNSRALFSAAQRLEHVLHPRRGPDGAEDRAVRSSMPKEHQRILAHRIKTLRSWAARPWTIPDYVCGDVANQASACTFPAIMEDVRRVQDSIAHPYDPSWIRQMREHLWTFNDDSHQRAGIAPIGRPSADLQAATIAAQQREIADLRAALEPAPSDWSREAFDDDDEIDEPWLAEAPILTPSTGESSLDRQLRQQAERKSMSRKFASQTVQTALPGSEFMGTDDDQQFLF